MEACGDDPQGVEGVSDKYNTPRFSREGGLFVGLGVVYDGGGGAHVKAYISPFAPCYGVC